MKPIYKILLLCLIIGHSSSLFASVKAIEDELNTYIDNFQQDNKVLQIDTAKKLEWSGFSDTRLFDLIEENLLAGYTNPELSKFEVDYLSWMAKALGFSGQKKYIVTLEAILSSRAPKKLLKHTNTSLKLLPQYTLWNKAILNESQWDKEESNNVNRFIFIVKSDALRLVLLAAKRVPRSHEYNEKLLDVFEEELLNNYQQVNGRQEIKTWALVAKALAGSRNVKYKPTIEKIAATAKNKKLKRYAKKYLKYY